MRILGSPADLVKFSIRSKRSLILAIAIVSVTAILLAVSIFVAKRSSAHGVTPAKKKQQGCCSGQQTTQVLYAPTTGLPGAGRAELVLNNNRQDDLAITPTIYSKDGRPVVCDQITLRSMEVRRMPVAELAKSLVEGVGNAGGISLSYFGGLRELRAQIALFGEGRAGTVDIPVSAAADYLSTVQEAVWWSPDGATATLALGNASDSPILVKLAFGSGEQREIQVGPFATEIVTHKSRKSMSSADAESVRLELSGAIGSLRVAGFVRSARMNFTSMIRFYDPQRVRQPNLYATNLRLKNSDPHVVLKNISNDPITATPKFLPLEGNAGNPLELPPVSLAPQEEREVDLAPLMKAAAERNDFEMVSVQVSNSGPTASLIGALCSRDKNSSITYEAPLRDSGDMRRSTGTYPWRVDEDYSTLVTITNVSHMQSKFVVLISYEDGQYVPGPQILEAGATAVFDLNKIQREQITDSHGQTIPQSVAGGQFVWSIITGSKETKLIGRMQIVSKANRASMSYSCESCCPMSFYEARVSPSSVNVLLGGPSGDLLVEERYFTNCNGQLWVSAWWVGSYDEFSNGQGEVESGDEEIATVSPSNQFPGIIVTGVRGGTTHVNITWEAPQWFFSGSIDACDVFLSFASTSANITVQAPQVTFQKSDGSALPSTLRVGITANNHDRRQQLRAVVEPSSAAANTTISVSSKLQISEISTSNGIITFKVVGTMESDNQGDQTITATHNSGTTATHPVTVAIPRKIGTPHPTFNGTVTGVNFVASRTSVPPFPDVPEGRVQLQTLYRTILNVLVWDKWDNPIGDLYSGATITENDIDTGITLTSSGTYPDPVGVGIHRDFPLIINYLPNDPIVQTWVTDSPKELLIGGTGTQNIAVKVDGFPLNPAVVNRTLTATPPNTLVITWP